MKLNCCEVAEQRRKFLLPCCCQLHKYPCRPQERMVQKRTRTYLTFRRTSGTPARRHLLWRNLCLDFYLGEWRVSRSEKFWWVIEVLWIKHELKNLTFIYRKAMSTLSQSSLFRLLTKRSWTLAENFLCMHRWMSSIGWCLTTSLWEAFKYQKLTNLSLATYSSARTKWSLWLVKRVVESKVDR